MNRRSFIAALAALPLVGRLFVDGSAESEAPTWHVFAAEEKATTSRLLAGGPYETVVVPFDDQYALEFAERNGISFACRMVSLVS